MYKIFLLICFPILVFSQKRIEGTIINIGQEKLPQVAVEVYDSQNKLIKTLITDGHGNFVLEGITGDSAKLIVNDLEYARLEKVFNPEKQDVPLILILKKETQDIQAVTLTKQKPLVKRKIDRLEFNVENSNITSLNVWEILKKTPGVTANNDVLGIKGSTSILVTINDKKVMLTGDELKNFLENIQGEELKSVEVITNPPAKYEASGNAILNIVMKKNTIEGYRGIFSSKYIQTQYAKGAVGVSQYYKKNKLSVMGSYNLARGTYYREGTDHVYYVEDQTRWVSTMNRKDRNKGQNTLNFNAEYEADSLTNISLNYSGYFSPKSYGIYNVPTLIYNAQNIAESDYTTINDHHSRSINNTLSFQADRKINEKSRLTWTGYFASNNLMRYQNVLTYLNFINQSPEINNFINQNKNNVQLYSTQADYQWKNDQWQLESGSKYSFVKTRNQLDFSDNNNGELQYRPDKSNTFNYKEHNFALYTSLAYNPGKWNFKAGLRAEKTDLEGVVSEPYEVNKDSYWKLFPTLYIQYSTSNNHQFGLSYGKRISRPSYSSLNPAKSYYNLFSYYQGDPKLKAAIIHNFNFTYTWKEWNFDLYYNKEINPSMEISLQEPSTNSLIYHYTNIEKGQTFGLSLYKNLKIKPWWNISLSENFEYAENYFIGVDNVLYKNKVWNWFSDVSVVFILDKSSDWKLETGHRYYSPSIQGTFSISGSSSTYLVMNKKFFNKKLEASLLFNDIFRTSREKISTKYANQDNFFMDYRDTQSFTVSLKFNFGNQSVKNTKTIKKVEEQGRM
ncbi:outer membrane beta-barrel family protein [Chryseobacterium daecheongense]|uniref:Outer membrane beta-barrel protein n=1 Tax=Chryseobacterium daecheongense TaxID=192389 RepID=A0A3N0VRZ6_9FLAO|nr:outer membrane beta-barrel family protein [Chryseobacterium daecheongense]ROH95582.1 TonB-dependent receptor [Chryseobacterium daecheongense]TDX92041.1 outer membrane beta-barrel protein [Chryseobacterium daecheongense]